MLLLFRCVVIVVILSILGCAPAALIREPIDDANAQTLFEQGEFQAAAREYQRLAKSNRNQRDLLLLRAAECLREEGDSKAWSELVARIKRKRLLDEEAWRLDLLVAEANLIAGEAQQALNLAIVPSNADAILRARAGEIRARALDQLARPLDALAERVRIFDWVHSNERTRLQNEMLDTLAKRDKKTLSSDLNAMDAGDLRRPWLERALRIKGGMPSRVMPKATRQVGTLLPSGSTQKMLEPEGYQMSSRVGLLLPLSGALANAGVAIRDGFLAAYFAAKNPRPKVRIFDSGETTSSALAAYKLALAEGMTNIVGPLSRDQVAAVMAESTLPVLALNHPESGAPPPKGSQYFGLLPDDEAAIAAEHAYAKGARRMSVITTTEEWGERAALAFRAQFEYLGGTLVGESRVATEGVDYTQAINQAMQGDSNAIFLAIRPAQGRLLVPQLRVRGANALPLFATSHLYAGTPNRSLDRDLNGVEFCDSPWLFGGVVGVPSREQLARSMPAAVSAPRLFAFGMDAYRLLPYVAWLSTNPEAYLPGATGQLAIDQFGRVRRILSWQRFEDGIPLSIDGGLENEAASSVP